MGDVGDNIFTGLMTNLHCQSTEGGCLW